jgi:putative copper export protein
MVVAAGLPAATTIASEREGTGPDGTAERDGNGTDGRDWRAGLAGGMSPVGLLVRAFSPIALAGAGTAIAAGVILAFRYLEGSITALWTTSYGSMLFRKLVILALIMALGAVNWRVITPKLGQPGGAARIRRSSALELLLGTVLLAVTAFLVSMPMPGE